VRSRALAIVAAVTLAACESPREREADALGPEPGPGEPGPRHRPGQPCLVCHSAEEPIGEIVFDVAGTVYEAEDDPITPGRDVEVTVTDADGETFVAITNVAGNFAIIARADVGQPLEIGEGIWQVPGTLDFPIRVELRRGPYAEEMKSFAHRERSCNACHAGDPGAASAGRVFLRRAP
jgi:hypothetical protein